MARQLVRELREGSRLKLDLDGTVIPVQIKEKSLDNLKHEILEISFQALSADQAVNSVIDIVLVNADKVTAVLEKLNMKIPYSALPADMIDTLEIDVDGMPVGTIVTVGDIPELKSEKLALQVNSDEIVFRTPTENAEEELLLRQRRLRGRIIAWLVLGNTGAVPWPEAEAVWKRISKRAGLPGRLEIWSAGRLFFAYFLFWGG